MFHIPADEMSLGEAHYIFYMVQNHLQLNLVAIQKRVHVTLKTEYVILSILILEVKFSACFLTMGCNVIMFLQ